MPTNYNQLLKDLEIGSVYTKIFICFLGSILILYPVLFSFTSFFRELAIYEQLLFAMGSSAIYVSIGIPFSIVSCIKYPGMFYIPLIILAIAAGICFYMPLTGWHHTSLMTLLCILLPVLYAINFIFGTISILREKRNPQNDMYY